MLSKRLQALADWVPEGVRLADVGTDHAYLPTWLLLQNKISFAVASDIHQGPLDRARATAERYQVGDRIAFYLTDGLAGIQSEQADAITIAGMGGEMMISILTNAPWAREKTLILQPMTSLPTLRKWLGENGFQITAERIVQEDGKYYTVMRVEKGKETPFTPGELYCGKPEIWQQEPQRLAYLEFMQSRLERQLRGAEHSSKPEDVPKAALLRQVISEIGDWKGTWDHENSI